MTYEEPGPAFGVEAATVEEFLRLLKEREEAEEPSRGPRSATRRAVFVAQLLDRQSSGYGHPAVGSSVVVAFAYGRDVVSYKRTTSSAVELPEIAKNTAERQQETYEEVRAEVERGTEGTMTPHAFWLTSSLLCGRSRRISEKGFWVCSDPLSHRRPNRF